MLEYLSSMHKALVQFPAPHIPGVVAHTYNHISREVKVRAKVQDHPQGQSEFEASMEYMRQSQKNVMK